MFHGTTPFSRKSAIDMPELISYLSTGLVLDLVDLDIIMPHLHIVQLGELEAQNSLVNLQQPSSHKFTLMFKNKEIKCSALPRDCDNLILSVCTHFNSYLSDVQGLEIV